MKNAENLAVGVDRGSDFSTEEIFHRLVSNEPTKLVYSEPQNEY